MPQCLAFKSGKDLAEEARIDDEDTVACVDCGAVESDERAYDAGWQLAPPVCPDCLRWCLVDECCLASPS